MLELRTYCKPFMATITEFWSTNYKAIMMKKICDIIVLVAVVIFLIILFQSSVRAGSRRGRTLEHHNSVIPFATLVPNNQRGYDYFVNGSRVGHSRKNNMGSYDIYIKGRLKYKGASFENSGRHNFRYHNYKTSIYRHNNKNMKAQVRWGHPQGWTAKREAQHANRPKVWEHFYPGLFGD